MWKTNLARRPVTALTPEAGEDGGVGSSRGDLGVGMSLIPRVWSMEPRPHTASTPASRPGSQESTRFFNISRMGSPRDDSAPVSRASGHADAGSRPRTSAHTQRNRMSVSGPVGRRPMRASESRAGLRTSHGGDRPPAKTPEGFKYLRRRTASPGTMRHNQIKDELMLLLKKHKEEVQKEEARSVRQNQAVQDRADLSRGDAMPPGVDENKDGQQPESQQQRQLRASAQQLETAPTVRWQVVAGAGLATEPASLAAAGVEPESSRHMAELSKTLGASFRSSLEQVSKRRDPLEQRLIGKKVGPLTSFMFVLADIF